MADRAGVFHPRKRVAPRRPGWYRRLTLAAEHAVLTASHEAMRQQRAAAPTGLTHYAPAMRASLRRLAVLRALGRAGEIGSGVVRRLRRLLPGAGKGNQAAIPTLGKATKLKTNST
jgi:hypothetical protein